MTPDFGLSYTRSFYDPEFTLIAEELRGRGLSVELEGGENEVYASLEWLIPTAVFIFVADKYFGALLEEAAKEHYPAIRAAAKRIVRKVFQRFGAFAQVYAVPAGKVTKSETHIVSILAKDRTGRLIKFLLDERIPVDTAIEEVFAILEQHYGPEARTSLIDAQVSGIPLRRSDQLVFARNESGWELCYPPRNRGQLAGPGE
jgi:hypothetical protein